MALEKLAKTPALLRKIGQVGDTRPFYSPVDKAISEITQNKATGEQMLAALLKTKGVAKELKDRPAIKKALEQPKITKQELERVAAEHPPAQIEESRSSGTFNQLEPTLPKDGSLGLVEDPPSFSGNRYPYGVRDTKTGDIIGYGWDKGDAILDVYSGYPRYWGKHAQYEQYTTPGGENYREILLKLPKGEGDVFKATHFEGEPNILAHARVADRTGPNGEKILHVEEIQSDWHQAGRKKGYGPKIEKTVEAYYETKDGQRIPVGFGKTREEADASIDIGWKNLVDIKYETFEKKIGEGVPDAPFKQNWHELVMKRLLDDAARNGYDKVVITPGTEQAKRYALSRHVNEIVVPMVNENGVRSVRIDPVDGTSIKLMVDQNGVVTGYGYGSNQFTGKSLDEVIGKDMADKVMNAAPDTKFSGGNLQVGGEGMKGFYDQILPSYLNDYGKPYGSRVGEYTMPEVATPLHSFDITPQMREDIIGKGLPLYQVAPVGIGAGAAMQGEQPEGYGAGGVVKKALKAMLPKGQQAVLPAAESAANLERFLADSAIKDRMYHGTFRGGFSTFDRNKTTEWRQPSMDTVGSWFSNNPSEAGGAGMYASGQDASIYPVYLSIKNPKVYNTFNDFLVDMHSAAGRELPKSAPGLGSTEELRQKLKAEGYDGIAFKQTANQSLMQDIQEMQDAVKRARMEELSMKRQEREPYTMKRERLEQTLNSMNKELSQYGSSTEFDQQRVFIPLEPTQIKSAIGNRGTYDITDPDITKADGGIVSRDEGEQLFRKRAQDLPSLMDSHERHKLQDLLQRTRIQGSGGKDQYGTGAGGRITHTVPLGNGMFVSPYIEGNLYKPVGQPAMGGVTGAGLNIGKTWKNGGSVSGDAMFMAVMNKNLKGKKNA